MIALRTSVALPLMAVLTTGCLVVPLQGQKPFKKKVTSFLTGGSTQKEEVIERLGRPSFVFPLDGGSMLAYCGHGSSRWFLAGCYPYGGGSDTFSLQYWYVLRIYLDSDGTVTGKDVSRMKLSKFRDTAGCTNLGICWDTGRTMFQAPRGMHLRAKDLTVPSNLCAVYLCSNTKVDLAMDGDSLGTVLNNETFALKYVEPGGHRASSPVIEFELECEAGQPYFLLVSEAGSEMELIDEDVGRGKIADRRLILTK